MINKSAVNMVLLKSKSLLFNSKPIVNRFILPTKYYYATSASSSTEFNKNINSNTTINSTSSNSHKNLDSANLVKNFKSGISGSGRQVKTEVRKLQKEIDDFENKLFEIYKSEKYEGVLPIRKFLRALEDNGIKKDDPRIQDLMNSLQEVHRTVNPEGSSYDTLRLTKELFKEVIKKNISLLRRAFSQEFIIPDFQLFTKDINKIYELCNINTEGKIASYIPQLSRYTADQFGVSVCTIDGQRYSVGDTETLFTIQSCSKPLTYAIALEHLGPDIVHSYVGQEPSGRMFNALILDYNNKPHNPMINSGAIMTCSLIQSLINPEMNSAEKFDFIQEWFKKMAGGKYFGFNNAVFMSEREAADRNYALGYYMREHKCFPEKSNLKDVLDFYFQCCSMEASCDTMSIVAGTLANGGICPITSEKILSPGTVRDVLSIMHSCGTYDYSGQFAFNVGLPAKSGVSGSMLISIPNIMGIFIWSPPLDTLGNSVRGILFCEELIKIFNFHHYDNLYAHGKKDPRKNQFETKANKLFNLLYSAGIGDIDTLRRFKLSGLDLSLVVDYDGRSALHLAASEGHFESVKFLCEICDIKPNIKDRWGNTAIDNAERFGFILIAEYLKKFSESGINSVKNDPKFGQLYNKSIKPELKSTPSSKINKNHSNGSSGTTNSNDLNKPK